MGQGKAPWPPKDAKGPPEHCASGSSPGPAASSALTFWLHADNLRPQVRRHPCDLILDDKLVFVFVAKRKLWKH